MAINSVCLTGRLTAVPELKTTQSGLSVCTVQLAVDRGYGDKKETDFIPLQFWRGQAETVCNYCGKGDMIGVEGSLQSRKYTDKEGNNRTIYEVVVNRLTLLGGRKEQIPTPAEPVKPEKVNVDELTDDFPF